MSNPGDVFPNRNLGPAEKWGRTVEERLEALESTSPGGSNAAQVSALTKFVADGWTAQTEENPGDFEGTITWATYPPSSDVDSDDPDDPEIMPDPDLEEEAPEVPPVLELREVGAYEVPEAFLVLGIQTYLGTHYILSYDPSAGYLLRTYDPDADEWGEAWDLPAPSPVTLKIYEGIVYVLFFTGGVASFNLAGEQIGFLPPTGNPGSQALHVDETGVWYGSTDGTNTFVPCLTHVDLEPTGEVFEPSGSSAILGLTRFNGTLYALYHSAIGSTDVISLQGYGGSTRELRTGYTSAAMDSDDTALYVAFDGESFVAIDTDFNEITPSHGLDPATSVVSVVDSNEIYAPGGNAVRRYRLAYEAAPSDPDPMPAPDPTPDEVVVDPQPVYSTWKVVDENGQIQGEYQWIDGFWEPRPSGGGAIAVDAISADHIQHDAVTVDKIADDAITATKIADGSIETPKLAANAVTAGKIAAGAVEAEKIAAGAVTANKISAGAIETEKLAANAVTTAKLDAEAVTANKIAAGAIIGEKIAANTIGAEKIQTETLGADQGFINVLNSSTIVGASIKTADSGKRVELDSENGIRVFNENDERVLWANNVGDLGLGGDLSLEGGTITAYGDDSVVTLSNSGLEMETRLPLKGPVIPGGEWVYNAAATETRILLGLGDGNIGVYTFAGKHDTTWNLGVSGTTPQVIRLVTTLTRAYAAVRPSNAILTLNPATGEQLGSFTAPFSVRGFDTNGTAFLMSEFTSSASDPGTLVRTNSSGSVLWTVTESSGIPAVKIVGSTVYYTVWGVNEVKAVSLSTGNSVSSGFSVDYPNYSGLDFWDDVFYLALGGSNRRVDRYSSEGDKLDPLITSAPAEGVRVSPFDGTVVVSTWDSGTAEVFFPGGLFEKSASFESSSGELKAISPNFTGGSRMDTLEVNQVLHYDANGKLDAVWPKSDFELWDRPAQSGVDLNDITHPGLHWFNSAELGNNYPEQRSGVLEVISRGSPGSTVLQKFRAVSSPIEYTRSRINGSWSAWERATPGGLIELPTRQDLNTLRSPGEYYIPSPGGIENTESLHYPLNRAGIITVVSSGESNSRIVQTFTEVPTSTKTGTFQYTRSRGTSDIWWSPWVMSTASAAPAIPYSTDLNDIIQPGSYTQTSSSPSLALNYPESSRGTLTVVSTGASNSLIEQRYVTTGTTSVAGNEYFRTRDTLASGWSPWVSLSKPERTVTSVNPFSSMGSNFQYLSSDVIVQNGWLDAIITVRLTGASITVPASGNFADVHIGSIRSEYRNAMGRDYDMILTRSGVLSAFARLAPSGAVDLTHGLPGTTIGTGQDFRFKLSHFVNF